MSRESRHTVTLDGGRRVTAVFSPAEGEPAGWTFIYAPGAGSNVDDPFGRYATHILTERGIACVRFQFPYQEVRRRSPDRTPVLEETWAAVIEQMRPGEGRLVAGGRSLGGRIASQIVAKGAEVDALALFAYPLHPPGKPEARRDEHLPSLRVPVLFCSGTKDAFASPEELREAAATVPGAAVHLLEDADHGFNVPKASGRGRQDVWAEAVDADAGLATADLRFVSALLELGHQQRFRLRRPTRRRRVTIVVHRRLWEPHSMRRRPRPSALPRRRQPPAL